MLWGAGRDAIFQLGHRGSGHLSKQTDRNREECQAGQNRLQELDRNTVGQLPWVDLLVEGVGGDGQKSTREKSWQTIVRGSRRVSIASKTGCSWEKVGALCGYSFDDDDGKSNTRDNTNDIHEVDEDEYLRENKHAGRAAFRTRSCL